MSNEDQPQDENPEESYGGLFDTYEDPAAKARQRIKNYLFYLLGKRDYSYFELEQKLKNRNITIRSEAKFNASKTEDDTTKKPRKSYSKKEDDSLFETSEQQAKAEKKAKRAQRKARKQEQKEPMDESQFDSVLQSLKEDGYQSDERFAMAFVRSKYNALNGPNKIRFELKNKQVESYLIEQALEQEECDWFEAALRLRIKKFGDEKLVDYKEKQKAYRYLAGRGFIGEMLNYALEYEGNE
jgi:regulatory protein